MRITQVTVEPLVPREHPAPSWLSASVIANPMSIYPEYYPQRSSWTAPFSQVLVRMTTDEGVMGMGVTGGGEAVRAIVRDHFSRLLIDQDPFDIERLWDQLYRSSLPYGRKGLSAFAISGVDIALWDLLGKIQGRPVYQLLGGSSKRDIPVYQTTNDPADWAESESFGIKLAMPHGPVDGLPGISHNLDLIRACRETIGPERDIMLDCFMAWDVEYTLRMREAVERFGVRWIEEPLPPDDYHGYEALGKHGSAVAIATGEHEYTRWGFRDLIETGGVTILQPDLSWVGGITETRRICALASAYHLAVVPHAGGLTAAGLHLIKSQVNAPYAEWVRTWDRNQERPVAVIQGVPDPIQGKINPSDEPGLGIQYATQAPR